MFDVCFDCLIWWFVILLLLVCCACLWFMVCLFLCLLLCRVDFARCLLLVLLCCWFVVVVRVYARLVLIVLGYVVLCCVTAATCDVDYVCAIVTCRLVLGLCYVVNSVAVYLAHILL